MTVFRTATAFDAVTVNESGGKQSKIAGKMTEVPPLALIAVGNVMGNGSEKYPREPDGTPNWHKINAKSNLDHSLEHAAWFQAEANQPNPDKIVLLEELAHHAARAMMALERFIIENDLVNEIKEQNL